MKMTKKIVLAAAALPLILGTASAYAYGGGDKGDHKGMHGKCGGFDKPQSAHPKKPSLHVSGESPLFGALVFHLGRLYSLAEI